MRGRVVSEWTQDTLDEIEQLRTWLVGRTIISLTVDDPRQVPGWEDSPPSVEGVQLVLDDGSIVELRAAGWHDIQELYWSRSAALKAAKDKGTSVNATSSRAHLMCDHTEVDRDQTALTWPDGSEHFSHSIRCRKCGARAGAMDEPAALPPVAVNENPDAKIALDALEDMVGQYLGDAEGRPGEYYHSFMSAGEAATEVLAALRPWKWRDTGAGPALQPGYELWGYYLPPQSGGDFSA